jgi:5'-methylthioadenosine phosphorylase
MEGPQFSTRAESELHRSWGASLIGMTVMPEAKLAREAELCYAFVALPTDYDCWKPHPASLDQAKVIEEILGNVKIATQSALELIRRALPHVAALGEKPCSCQSSLALGIWSDRARIPAETRERLKPILGKYLG